MSTPSLRGASGAFFFTHTTKTLFSLALLGSFGLELAHLLEQHAHRSQLDATQAAWIVELAYARLPGQLTAMLAIAAGYALVAPFLSQVLFAALVASASRSRASFPAAVRQAAARYPFALAWSLLRWLAIVAICAAFAALIAHAPQFGRGLAVVESTWRWSAVGMGAATVLWISTAHDFGAAAIALSPGSRTSLVRAALRRVSSRITLVHLGYIATGAAVAVCSEWVARTLPNWLSASVYTLAAQQALALAESAIGAQWLAAAAVEVFNDPARRTAIEPESALDQK